MKKLLFLVPVGLWIATYYVWVECGKVFAESVHTTAPQFWWFITSMMSVGLVIASFIVAIKANLE